MRRLLIALTALSALSAIALAAPAPAGAAWVWPMQGDVITPYRNGTDPYATGQHRGIDIAAPVGTPVVAAAGGNVRFAGTAGSSGLTISIRTGDGYDTSYLHLSSLAVRAGAQVSAGDRIGAVGTTGTRSATAPHLHFGVRDAGIRHAYHDPLAFLPPPPMAPEPNPPAPAPATTPAPAPTSPGPALAPAPTGLASPRATPMPRSAPAPRATLGPRPAPRANHAPVPAPADEVLAPRSESRRGGVQDEARTSSAPRQVPRGVTRAPTVATAAHPHSPPFAARLRSGDGARVPAQRRDQKLAPRGDAAHGSSGPDIGWALACGGLLLAAAILGITGDRHSTARRRVRIADPSSPLPRG